MQKHSISPASHLGLDMLSLSTDLRLDGVFSSGGSRTTRRSSHDVDIDRMERLTISSQAAILKEAVETSLKPMENRLNDFAAMLNTIAEAVGVDLLPNDEQPPDLAPIAAQPNNMHRQPTISLAAAVAETPTIEGHNDEIPMASPKVDDLDLLKSQRIHQGFGQGPSEASKQLAPSFLANRDRGQAKATADETVSNSTGIAQGMAADSKRVAENNVMEAVKLFGSFFDLPQRPKIGDSSTANFKATVAAETTQDMKVDKSNRSVGSLFDRIATNTVKSAPACKPHKIERVVVTSTNPTSDLSDEEAVSKATAAAPSDSSKEENSGFVSHKVFKRISGHIESANRLLDRLEGVTPVNRQYDNSNSAGRDGAVARSPAKIILNSLVERAQTLDSELDAESLCDESGAEDTINQHSPYSLAATVPRPSSSACSVHSFDSVSSRTDNHHAAIHPRPYVTSESDPTETGTTVPDFTFTTSGRSTALPSSLEGLSEHNVEHLARTPRATSPTRSRSPGPRHRFSPTSLPSVAHDYPRHPFNPWSSIDPSHLAATSPYARLPGPLIPHLAGPSLHHAMYPGHLPAMPNPNMAAQPWGYQHHAHAPATFGHFGMGGEQCGCPPGWFDHSHGTGRPTGPYQR